MDIFPLDGRKLGFSASLPLCHYFLSPALPFLPHPRNDSAQEVPLVIKKSPRTLPEDLASVANPGGFLAAAPSTLPVPPALGPWPCGC